MNNNISGYDPNTGQPIINNYNNSNQPVKNSKNVIVIVLAVIGGIVVFLVVLIIAIFSLVSASSNKLVCTSNQGDITIMYDDSKIVGYTVKKARYDMDQQQKIAEQIGIDNYISQFKTWFETNTTGKCTIEEK